MYVLQQGVEQLKKYLGGISSARVDGRIQLNELQLNDVDEGVLRTHQATALFFDGNMLSSIPGSIR